jgi:hypothetical protein
MKYLYPQNQNLSSRKIKMLIHELEVVHNIYNQPNKLKRKLNVKHLFGFVIMLSIGVTALLSGVYAALQGVAYILSFDRFDVFSVIRVTVVFGLSFFVSIFGIRLCRGSLKFVFSITFKQALNLVENLILDHQKARGTVLEVKITRKKVIYYLYFTPNQEEIIAQFETSSDVSITEGDELAVIYNEFFSVLL